MGVLATEKACKLMDRGELANLQVRLGQVRFGMSLNRLGVC